MQVETKTESVGAGAAAGVALGAVSGSLMNSDVRITGQFNVHVATVVKGGGSD
jgi:hypothetical protein